MNFAHTYLVMNLAFKFNQWTGDFLIMITKRQKGKTDKTVKDNMWFILTMSESQVKKQSQNGGFLGALAESITKNIIPLASKFIPKIIAPLATSALTSVGHVAMKTIMGQRMINVPNNMKIHLIKSNTLTNKHLNKLKRSPYNVIFNWLTNKCKMMDSLEVLL